MERTSEQEAPDSTESSAMVAKSIGAVVAGTYRLTRHIGSGGSSHVFEAEHIRLGKLFAVKLLRPELDPTRQTAKRFRREARAIAKLKSEYIVSVVDCGELADQTPYLVMELLEGEDLRSLLARERTLPARRAVNLLVEACRALAEAHAAGLVHRDLKPENLFITRRSTGEDWCKVLDFGVAKMDASMSTTQGAIVGTVRYMAPEQLADGANVGPAADIHALGAILYECLSGRPAHTGESVQEVMFSVLNKQPAELAAVPARFSDLVLGCLAKDPQNRPASARRLEELLTASLPGPALQVEYTSAEESEPRVPAPPAANARPLRVWVPVAIAAVATASALTWLRSGRPPLPTAEVASQVLAAAAQGAPLPTVSEKHEHLLKNAPSVTVPPSSVPSAVAAEGKPNPPLPTSSRIKPPSAFQFPPPGASRPPAVGNLDPSNPYAE